MLHRCSTGCCRGQCCPDIHLLPWLDGCMDSAPLCPVPGGKASLGGTYNWWWLCVPRTSPYSVRQVPDWASSAIGPLHVPFISLIQKKVLFNSMLMKDVEQREVREQKPLSHTAKELGDNWTLFSTPSLPLPPRRNRQRTCHDQLLEKGFDITVSRAVMESRAVHILLDARLILAVRNGSAVVRVFWIATSPYRGRGLYDSAFKTIRASIHCNGIEDPHMLLIDSSLKI